MSQHSPIPDLSEVDPEALSNPAYLNLDWDAYFDSFKDVHGEPVRWRGVLLFADGWCYSAKDKSGPEYKPPTDSDELHQLKLSYWLTRFNMVRVERDILRDVISGLRALERSHSLPLQQQTFVYDEATGKQRARSQQVNIDELEQGRLAWLEQDVADCQARLEQLERSAPLKQSAKLPCLSATATLPIATADCPTRSP